MQNLAELLTTDTTGTNWIKPTDTTGTDNTQYSVYENDLLFTHLNDLVTEQFRPWFCRQFYRLGKDRVLQLAAVARADGQSPPRLFSKLLKEAN